jgi:hypothetical protein
MFECLYGWRPPAMLLAPAHLTSPLSPTLCATIPSVCPLWRARVVHASAVRANMTTSLMTTTTTAFPERSHSFLAPSSFDPYRRCALCHPHPPRPNPHIKRRVIYAQGHHRLPPVHPTSHTTLKIHDHDAYIPVCFHGTATQLKNSYRRSSLHYRAAFSPLVGDPGRFDTACPINTARSFFAILGQVS